MRKILRYLEWIPFAVSLGSLVIYLVYTIQIKLHPAIIVTDSLINTLKIYLIIALVSLFIGLLIILIKKIRRLMVPETNKYIYKKEEKIVTTSDNDIKVVQTEIKTEPKTEVVSQTKVIEETKVNNYTYKVNGIVCPECNNQISKNAGICPHCGILFDDEIIKVIKKYDKEKYKIKRNPFIFIANMLLTILFIILIFLICNLLYNKYNENIKNINYMIQRH